MITRPDPQALIAAIQNGCPHAGLYCHGGSIDDRDGKRHYFTIWRCRDCGSTLQCDDPRIPTANKRSPVSK